MGKKTRYWTEERIIQTLKDLDTKGENIRPGHLSNSHPGLWAAGRRLFGSSDGMYAAAGFTKSELNIRRHKYWTEERIKEAVLDRFHNGKDMSWKAVSDDNSALLGIVEKKFGSWQNVLEICGIPYPSKRRTWTDEKVKDAILTRYESGKDMRGASVSKEDYGLFRAATRRYGSWYKALESLGIEVARPRKWTSENVIEEILKRHEMGKDMREVAVLDEDTGLVTAAYRRYGSWYQALDAAGIPYQEFKNIHEVIWTEENLIARVKKLHSKGEDIRPVALKKNHYGLYRAGLRLFGNIANLFRAAGLDLSELPVRRPWTEDEDEFLRENYETMEKTEICKILGRSPNGVTHRINRLGLSKKHQKPWTGEELNVLCDPYLTVKEKRELLPDRTLERIRYELHSRKLDSKPDVEEREYPSGDYVRLAGKEGLTDFGERRYRIVASEMIGRPLRRNELVHHINMNKKDDRPENLFICSVRDHLAAHGSLNRIIKGLMERNIVGFNEDSGYQLNPPGFYDRNNEIISEPPPEKIRYSMVRDGGHLIRRCRIVAEEKIGRPLRNDEVVHHINMDSSDDRPENLLVVEQAKHKAIHMTMDKLVKELMAKGIISFNRESKEYFIV